jgi:hypothetical protein
MNRDRWIFAIAVAALLLAALVFKVRIAVAGFRYVIAVLAIVAVVWLIVRWRR